MIIKNDLISSLKQCMTADKIICVMLLFGVRTGDPWILANQPTTCVSNRDQLGHFYCEIRITMN